MIKNKICSLYLSDLLVCTILPARGNLPKLLYGLCAAFLANVDSQRDATVNFNGNSYNLPAWSMSFLPDCKNVVLNTAKVGVDNMCILVHAMKRQPQELPLEGRISNALVEVGPSITLASLSEVLAFAVGSFISMPASRVFSMFAALAVLLDFLLQVTAFVALTVFDISRAEDNRVDCFPCLKVPSSSVESVEVVGNRRSLGLLARYMKEVHARVLRASGESKLLLLLSLLHLLWQALIEPGLEQQIALPRDSYLQGYFNDVSEYLRIGPPLYFVVKDYNYRYIIIILVKMIDDLMKLKRAVDEAMDNHQQNQTDAEIGLQREVMASEIVKQTAAGK
ncbi:NPC intracellular cholesterol transporter 1 [Camellia lanceoleosa]|uniref:NPC intracellular cholesterol transporter 1 n=1 Tax=Camellia lanceoleosa TaxID=1840588 RepID=A0ACC0H5G4_9ERIC|nr:NPC intracellular cholesterol transporter 1 [Camellia lanceoleosa]